MKVIAIASAKGGSTRTTSAVRLAQALNDQQIPTGIVDLAPYPSVQFLLNPGDSIPVISGRTANTKTAAQSIIKPYFEKCSCLIIDTSRLDDPALEAWLPLITHFFINLKIDRNSIEALPSVWDSIDSWKITNPQLEFLGFLPVCLEQGQERVLENLRSRLKSHILPIDISYQEEERLGSDFVQRSIEWDNLARYLHQAAGLKKVQPQPVTRKETGLVSKMWRIAASMLSPKVTIAREGN